MDNPNNYLITTIDNPYNPFVDWDSWYAFDQLKGYRTCQIIDKFYKTSDLISPSLDEALYEDAIETILDLFPYYIVVDRETKIKPVEIDKIEEILGINKNRPMEDEEKTRGGV